jgi:hypothetical protein
VLSGRIATQTVISGEPSAARTTAGPNGGKRSPSANPPPTAAELMMKERRLTFGMNFMAPSPYAFRGGMDRRAHFLERSAAADIRDRRVDVGIRRARLLGQQRCRGHDHSRLAEPALRHIVVEPGFLHLVQLVPRTRALRSSVIFLPAAALTGIVQERTARRPCEPCRRRIGRCRKPYFVPVSPTCSRIAQSSGVLGSTSTSWFLPLMDRRTIVSPP